MAGPHRVGEALDGVHPPTPGGCADGFWSVVAGSGLGRDGGSGRLARREPRDEGRELDVVRLAADHADVGGHSGMFPCFLAGIAARLVRRVRRALTTCERVADGAMTASTNPRSAASYGLTSASS